MVAEKYTHKTVNHIKHYVDSVAGIHTNIIDEPEGLKNLLGLAILDLKRAILRMQKGRFRQK